MQTIFYVPTNGLPRKELPVYEAFHGDVLITIVATGMSDDVTDPQHVGRLSSYNTRTFTRNDYGLIWDDSRCLVTSGVEGWTEREERALLLAGFLN